MLQADCASLSLSLSVWGLRLFISGNPVVFLCGHILTCLLNILNGVLVFKWSAVHCCTRATISIQGQLYRYSYRQISVTIHAHIELICIRRVFSKCSHVREKLWTATHGHFVNLGEEVILTLLWQSGSSESTTVCFVISISICYWLFRVRTRVCVCVRERGSHLGTSAKWIAACVWGRERVTSRHISYLSALECDLISQWCD